MSSIDLLSGKATAIPRAELSFGARSRKGRVNSSTHSTEAEPAPQVSEALTSPALPTMSSRISKFCFWKRKKS